MRRGRTGPDTATRSTRFTRPVNPARVRRGDTSLGPFTSTGTLFSASGHGVWKARLVTAAITGECHRRMACCGAMQVRYRYRIYPSPGQQQALARAFGCARVVYNDCLRLREEAYAAGE